MDRAAAEAACREMYGEPVEIVWFRSPRELDVVRRMILGVETPAMLPMPRNAPLTAHQAFLNGALDGREWLGEIADVALGEIGRVLRSVKGASSSQRLVAQQGALNNINSVTQFNFINNQHVRFMRGSAQVIGSGGVGGGGGFGVMGQMGGFIGSSGAVSFSGGGQFRSQDFFSIFHLGALAVKDVSAICAWRGACLMADGPTVDEQDADGRPHCEDGPAIAFSDGWRMWAWHGTAVPQHVIEAPESITAKEVSDEWNAEVRRVMLDRYGVARWIKDMGIEPIQSDEYGILYRANLSGDEPIAMVEVTNSTPEPDGSIKKYMLRVPPAMRTAHEAVAWTFGMKPEEYAPEIET